MLSHPPHVRTLTNFSLAASRIQRYWDNNRKAYRVLKSWDESRELSPLKTTETLVVGENYYRLTTSSAEIHMCKRFKSCEIDLTCPCLGGSGNWSAVSSVFQRELNCVTTDARYFSPTLASGRHIV